MNCKPGDLARIVKMAPQEPRSLDSIVTVLHAGRPGFYPAVGLIGEQPVWIVECSTPLTLAHTGKKGRRFAVPDAFLRPIRDPGDDATDETLAWLPSPIREVA